MLGGDVARGAAGRSAAYIALSPLEELGRPSLGSVKRSGADDVIAPQ